ITWTSRTAAGDNDSWVAVTYGNGTFVAVGDFGDRVMTGADATLTLPVDIYTQDLTVSSASTLVATTTINVAGNYLNNGYLDADSATLDVTGNYTNSGTFVASTSKVIFSGTAQQTATGTLTASSSFYDLTITNTSENGTTSQSVIFGAAVTVDNTFTMVASTSAQFTANSTASFNNVDWQGATDSEVWLRSSVADTAWTLNIDGSQLNVEYVNVKDSDATLTSGGVDAASSTDSGNNTNWNFLTATVGSTTISDHDDTQVNDAFNFQNKTNEPFYAFKITPESGNATVTDLVITLSGAKKIDPTDFSNIKLWRDMDNDGVADGSAGDIQIGGAGVMALSDRDGTITFSTDFLSTTTLNYLITADWNAPPNGSFLNLDLQQSGITAVDDNGAVTVFGNVDYVQHTRNNKGGGGSSAAAVGGAAPAGNGTVTGGTNDGGELIGDDPDFNWPTANSGLWSTPANAYDQVDGTYASDASGVSGDYTSHFFVINSGNTINGVEVKLEVSGTTAAGDIGVQLSWDGGTSWTTTKTTPTLTTTDTVVSLGGPADLWGRTWTESEFSNANFSLRVTGNPSSNTVQIDALQVKVFHQTGGGGAGGGGAI
ncbi:MAG: hypothetical protein LR008_00060, partial [Candidatus Pacebacteria bacterium]|nr:hypothetical protein [Candidatus Paceibacterota bacterium]